MNDVRERMRAFVLDNFVFDADSSALEDDTDLKSSGVLDSLGILRLTGFIEDEFQVQLELEDVEALNALTFAALETLVISRIATPSGNAPGAGLLCNPSAIDR